MFKLVIFTVAICAVNAGVIGIGDYGGYGYGHGAVLAAPVAVAHHATSYQNHNQISLHPTAVVAHHAAPVAVVAHAAPVAVAHIGHVSHVGVGVGHAGLGGIGGYGHGY